MKFVSSIDMSKTILRIMSQEEFQEFQHGSPLSWSALAVYNSLHKVSHFVSLFAYGTDDYDKEAN